MIEYRRTKRFTAGQLEKLFCSVGWFSGAFPEKLKTAMENSGAVVSAWDGERLVGLGRGLDDGAWQADVDCLLVDPEYQGRGIASSLLRTLLDGYKDYLYVYVVPEERKNVAFYEKHGFSVMEEGTAMLIKNAFWRGGEKAGQ